MPISIANIIANNSDVSASSFVTASVTPAPNRLMLLSFAVRKGDSTQPTAPAVSGNGLTWSEITEIYFDTAGSSRKSLFLYKAFGAAPTTGAITIDFGAQTITNINFILDQVTGADLANTTIVQSNTNKEDAGDGGILTVTLGAFSNPNNATYGVFAGDPGTGTVTVGSGFTKLGAIDTATMELGSEWTALNDTSVDATFDVVAGTSTGGIAIEIKSGRNLGFIQNSLRPKIFAPGIGK